MNKLLLNWLLPRTTLRFTASTRHVMDEIVFFHGATCSNRCSRHATESLVPALALVGNLSELGVVGAEPELPTPTDVPVPEPFDVPVPEPMDVPPPEPRDVPPPEPRDVPPPQPKDPEVDPQPRPIP